MIMVVVMREFCLLGEKSEQIPVVSRTVAPRDVHALTREPVTVTWRGQKDFANGIMVQEMNGEIIPNYPSGPDLMTGVLKRGGLFPAVVESEMRRRKGQRDMRLLTLKLEEGGRKPRNAGGSTMLEETRDGF